MLLGRLNRLIEGLVAGIGLGMALLVAVQVFCRYVLNSSLFWSEELARFMLVWLSFLGATVAYYRGLHPGVDLVTGRLPPRLRRYCAILVQLASLLFFAVMVAAGARFAWFVRLQVSSALGLPKWAVLSVIPVAGVLLFLYAFSALLDHCKRPEHDR